ncbi:MAG: HEAT repeat domain-containing protein [Phycisphaerae bacterium]|nr:HEAT repeat domain-containing protein [Phycisphaerae bacterium]NUQ45373.1 HEAT repeat domain-containing protein [Phycisphaerae bacterium]
MHDRLPILTARLVLGLAVLICAPACTAPVTTADIQSPDAERRLLAVRAAAQRGDRQALPLIVDRLEDEDAAVRFSAILALERLTGQRMGYQYSRPPETQSEAIRRWRRYVVEHGPAGTTTDADASVLDTDAAAPTSRPAS